ncbi:MAG: hypothetical protein Q9183_005658, partial [Haloplaca sp. 2 TL-2023]
MDSRPSPYSISEIDPEQFSLYPNRLHHSQDFLEFLTVAKRIIKDRSLAEEERDVVMSVCDELKTIISPSDAEDRYDAEYPDFE